jgi:hypothetical protein
MTLVPAQVVVELLLLRGCRGFCVAIGCVVGGTLAPGPSRIMGWIGIIVLVSVAAAALPFAMSLFCRPQQRLLATSVVPHHAASLSSPTSSSTLPSAPSVGSVVVIVLILQLLSVALCGYPLPKALQPTWVASLKPFNIYSHALQVLVLCNHLFVCVWNGLLTVS